jgi:DNA-binding transcriptional MerR regulator
MKISELVKQTGVPKETIHFYIREGLLRKPYKSAINAAEYNQSHVRQLLLIKDLRNNYYLPIPEIKRIVRNYKKQSPSDRAASRVNSRYFRPMERLVENAVEGREAFRESTGLSEKWLASMEAWGIITPTISGGRFIYSQDDMILGRLLVDMDRMGFGPKDGYNPEDLKAVSDFIGRYVSSGQNKYLAATREKIAAGDIDRSGSQMTELMSLFFYHMYRKTIRANYRKLIDEMEEAEGRP